MTQLFVQVNSKPKRVYVTKNKDSNVFQDFEPFIIKAERTKEDTPKAKYYCEICEEYDTKACSHGGSIQVVSDNEFGSLEEAVDNIITYLHNCILHYKKFLKSQFLVPKTKEELKALKEEMKTKKVKFIQEGALKVFLSDIDEELGKKKVERKTKVPRKKPCIFWYEEAGDVLPADYPIDR
jgi:hypothetical protein